MNIRRASEVLLLVCILLTLMVGVVFFMHRRNASAYSQYLRVTLGMKREEVLKVVERAVPYETLEPLRASNRRELEGSGDRKKAASWLVAKPGFIARDAAFIVIGFGRGSDEIVVYRGLWGD